MTPKGEWLVDVEEKTYNVFYVPDAVHNPYVPVQKEFVRKFGVASVLCFGGMLPSRDLFAVILFSRTPVPRDTAMLCKSLALSLKASLLAFDETADAETERAAQPAAKAVGALAEQLETTRHQVSPCRQ